MSGRLTAALALVLTASSEPATAACTLGKMLEFPVTMSGLRPMAPAKVNGVEKMFLIDSGAFFSSINPATVAELKLPREALPWNLQVVGIGGIDYNAYQTEVKVLTLGDYPVPGIHFIVTAGAADGAGLFGQNILGLADVEYDLADGVVRLFKPDGCDDANMAYWAKDANYAFLSIRRVERTDAHTIGEAFVNGVKITVVFDTGAAGSVLTRQAAERIGIKLDAPDVRFVGLNRGVGPRAAKTWIAPVASFKVGGEEIRNTSLKISDFTTDDIGGGDMLLGADFFLSHRVYVSNRQHKLYFTYNGGAVFNIGQPVLVQDGPDGTPKAPVEDTGEEPKDADGYLRRGAAFLARREFDRAIADFDQACALAPDNPKAFYQRALAHAQNKQPALVMSDLDQTLKLDPKNVEALVMRGGLRLGERDKTGATDLDTAASLVSQEADLRLELAELYERAELFDAAVGQYDLWISAHRDDGRAGMAFNGRCWARAVLGRDLDKALSDCNHALGAAPHTAAFLDSRGLVRLRLGDNDKAIADYSAALAVQPKLAWSLYGRGLAELRKGMTAQGQADIAAAVAINAKLPDQAKARGIVGPDGA
jgi:tetratricopeptide (TPR) repeat protein